MSLCVRCSLIYVNHFSGTTNIKKENTRQQANSESHPICWAQISNGKKEKIELRNLLFAELDVN